MSRQKKQKGTITNRTLLARINRIPLVNQCKVSVVIAYIGLNLVNKGEPVEIGRGLRIVHRSKLHHQIESNIYIPCANILDAMIHLVIYKRKLLEFFFTHPELPIWEDETAGPLFDILYEISKIYRI